MRAGTSWIAMVLLVVGTCGACADVGVTSGSATVPTAATDIATDVSATAVASAATAAPPALPPPCSIDDLSVWTAQVSADTAAGTAAPVLRVRNDGDVRCEADISRSANRADEVEPNVWLDPGAWADLVTAESAVGCGGDVEAVTSIELTMNGATLSVPTAAATRCGLVLAAYLLNEPADRDCTPDDVRFRASDNGSWFVAGNVSADACRLGASLAAGDVGPAPAVEIEALAPGDVVAWRYADPVEGCADTVTTLQFEVFTVETVEVPPCVVPAAGPAGPYHGDPDTPFVIAAGSGGGSIALVDPFSG